MKKIVALALCLVLALSLCATAFAATPAQVGGLYDIKDAQTLVLDDDLTGVTLFKTAAVAPKSGNGYIGNVEFYQIGTAAGELEDEDMFIKVTDSEDADFVVYKTGKTVVDFYLAAVEDVSYALTGVLYTNYGDKCEQIDADYSSTKFYAVTTVETGAVTLMTKATAAQEDEAVNVLVDGSLIAMVSALSYVNDHSWEADTYNTDNSVKTYKCADCGKVATVYTKAASVPAGAFKDTIGANAVYYTVDYVAATSTAAVSSAKTFDAGIAMYVGMAVSAVAGSAVVIGKKKEF